MQSTSIESIERLITETYEASATFLRAKRSITSRKKWITASNVVIPPILATAQVSGCYRSESLIRSSNIRGSGPIRTEYPPLILTVRVDDAAFLGGLEAAPTEVSAWCRPVDGRSFEE